MEGKKEVLGLEFMEKVKIIYWKIVSWCVIFVFNCCFCFEMLVNWELIEFVVNGINDFYLGLCFNYLLVFLVIFIVIDI